MTTGSGLHVGFGKSLLFGLAAGCFGGLVGLGGGVVMIPLMVGVAGLQQKQAGLFFLVQDFRAEDADAHSQDPLRAEPHGVPAHRGCADSALRLPVARHHGGTFLLRIEDTDRERSTEEATRAILFAPAPPEAPDGMPVAWRWQAGGPAVDVVLRVTGAGGERRDTLRFDAAGRAEVSLPPGTYRYAAADGPERGVFVVETYSDEWRPARVTIATQAGSTGDAHERRGLRDTWWLFALALAVFAAEWYWRRREGLP